MSDATPPPMPPATPQTETLNQQIDRLNQSVVNLQTLADRARAQGDFVHAMELSGQSVALGGEVSQLRQRQRGQLFQSATWRELNAHLDALNVEAQKTEGQMQNAESNVATAKTIIGLVGKLATAL